MFFSATQTPTLTPYQFIETKHICPLQKLLERLGEIAALITDQVLEVHPSEPNPLDEDYLFHTIPLSARLKQQQWLQNSLETMIRIVQTKLNDGDAEKFWDSALQTDYLFSSDDQDKLLYAFGLLDIAGRVLQSTDFQLNRKSFLFPLICRYIFPAIKAIQQIAQVSDRSQRIASIYKKEGPFSSFYNNLKSYLQDIYNLVASLDDYAMSTMYRDIQEQTLAAVGESEASWTVENLSDFFDDDISKSICEFIREERRSRQNRHLSQNSTDLFSQWLQKQTVNTIITLWINKPPRCVSLNKEQISDLFEEKEEIWNDSAKTLLQKNRFLNTFAEKAMALDPLFYIFFPQAWLDGPLLSIAEEFKGKYEERLHELLRHEEDPQELREQFEEEPERFIRKGHFTKLFGTCKRSMEQYIEKVDPMAIELYRYSSSTLELCQAAFAGYIGTIRHMPWPCNSDYAAHKRQRELARSKEPEYRPLRTPNMGRSMEGYFFDWNMTKDLSIGPHLSPYASLISGKETLNQRRTDRVSLVSVPALTPAVESGSRSVYPGMRA